MTDLVLKIDGVSKHFGGRAALKGVNFDVARGEIVGLIGPNGAGKTTIFNLVSGNLRPSEGDILFNGRSVLGRYPHKLCRLGMGRTYQIMRPFGEMTVLENVMVAAFNRVKTQREARELAQETLQYVGLGPSASRPAKTLTIPEKKRLELAKALGTQPTLLLLDEVFAGLTPAEIDQVLPIIQKINQDGISILIIEHVMKVIMNLSKRIIVINNGMKLAEGDPKGIANNPKVIEAYLGAE